jgi:glyoxylase-like metal-dependent hydrolase (beta-lactamase superfamily II)
MYLNGEGIEIIHPPSAHTDGDSIVFFRSSDVILAGDVVDLNRFPVIDLSHGGSIQGELDALNRIIDLAIPSIPLMYIEGGTRIVPGHGRLCEQADVVWYRDMVTIVRNRIQGLMREGKSLDAIKAANPTEGYRSRYGSDSGPWTTDMFVESIYRSLGGKK